MSARLYDRIVPASRRTFLIQRLTWPATIRLKRSRSRSPSPMMENGKLTAAQSMESIDNMSTTSAVPPAQVRTLFVSGLPMDAKPRELYLLFRAYSGYESSLLKITSKNGKTASPVGFVTFSTKAEADEARKALQGVRFDPDNAQTIRLELARSNTKVSKPKQISPPVIPNGPSSIPQAMLQSAAAAPHQFVTPLPTSHAHDLATAAACLDPHMAPFLTEHQLLALSTLPQFAQTPLLFPAAAGLQIPSVASSAAAAMFQPSAAALAQLTAASQAAAQLSAVSQAAAAATASTTACSTLFVANLGQSVNEEELKQIFRSFPGFCRLRMHTKGGTSVAFVEYSDIRQATQAMTSLQGFQISSSERGGMRIEYAKNKMGDIFRSFPGFCRLRMHTKGGTSVAFVEYSDIRQATQAMTSLQGFQISSSERGGMRIEYAKNKMGDVSG
ncbi:Protein couch potato [Toxocara canis]|uniref:Protein couch potato n=1 Tax=Toxocara canis TaxID=6265 RepID=A0A0B2V6P1_TOXCA|nr:Protein couch potato [Toxocara canis]